MAGKKIHAGSYKNDGWDDGDCIMENDKNTKINVKSSIINVNFMIDLTYIFPKYIPDSSYLS